MKLGLTMVALLGILLLSPAFTGGAKALELEEVCGDFSFLGGGKVYVGKLSNGRKGGLVLFDPRSETGRVLVLYAYGTRPDGSGGQGCAPYFGQIDGNTLLVPLGRGAKATYNFGGSGAASLEWSRERRDGRVDRLKGELERRP